jgi:NTE family protein
MNTARHWLQEAVEKVRAFAYRRPARGAFRRPRVGLALGGGFARGIAHIGVLRVLDENKVPIDFLAGTSVGALIASAYACGAPLAEMERQASATEFKDFGRWTLSWLGLASNERLENYLQRFCTPSRFEDLKIPLAIAATDLKTGEPVYFTKGELGPPMRASCAYPGLFLPVEHEGRNLVDGFVSAPVPVEPLRQMGAEFVIGVFLASGPDPSKPRNMADVIGRAFSILQHYAHQRWRDRADVAIEPEVKHFLWDDFESSPEIIAAGEAATRAALPKILAALGPPQAVSAGRLPVYH